MLHEFFYYMVFTPHSPGKIRSSICMQDNVKPALHYEICLTEYYLLRNQINLMKTIT